MANKIKPKRSYTASAVPTTSDLDTNELAINWTDGKAYTKNAAGNIVTVTLGGGGSSYTLPVATGSVLGGVKTGSNVTIAGDGTLSVAAPTTDASSLTSGTLPAARLPSATSSTIGGVIVGGGLSVSSGTVSADLRSNTSGITGAAAVTNIVSLTAAQYAALSSKNSSTLYIVSG
jgi:hypothetical protein